MHAHVRTIALAAALLSWNVGLAVCAGADSSAAPADELFQSAADHYAKRQWQAACDDFSKLLATAPQYKRVNQARFHLGESLVQLKRYGEAQEQFEELLRLAPEDRYARHAEFRAGEAAYFAGNLAEARRRLGEFRGKHPDDALNAYVLAHLGRIELDDGKPAAAETFFADAVEQFPDSPLVQQCQMGLSEAREALGQIDAARRGYDQLVESRSNLADYALLRLAALDNDAGDHAAALERLERFERELPSSPLINKARLGRGYAQYQLGRYADAEKTLAALTSTRSPLVVDAHYWLGMSQVAREDWDAGAKTFAAGAAIDTSHRLSESLVYQAARALLQGGQYPAATERFDELLQKWPDSTLSDESVFGKLQAAVAQDDHAAAARLAEQFNTRFPESTLRAEVEAARGRALAALGKHSDAVAALERSLARPAPETKQEKTADKNDAGGIVQRQGELAMSYAQLERFNEAAEVVLAMYEAKDADSAADEACYQVAERAYAHGELETADRLFTQLVEHGGSDEARRRGLLGQGWCRFGRDDWDGAALALGQLLERFPRATAAAEATLLRGQALENANRADEALAMYRRLIDDFPDDARAAQALYRAARVHDRRDQAEEAVAYYARLVECHSTFDELAAALYRWAWLVRDSQPAKSAELFARLRAEFPDSPFLPDASLQLAERAFADKDYPHARTLLEDISRSNVAAEVRRNGLYLSGRVAAAESQWEEADETLGRLVSEPPHDELTLAAAFLRAEASYRLGRFDESAERLATLLGQADVQAQPWVAAAQLRRAQALVQQKQWSEALEAAQDVLERYPDFDRRYEADYVVGRCMAAQADFAAARDSYMRVIESISGANTETAAMAQWMIGESYFHQQNHVAALAAYERVDTQFPYARWRAAALLQAGKCHEHLGQWDRAIATYQRMLKECPAHDLSAEAQRRAEAARSRVARRGSPSH